MLILIQIMILALMFGSHAAATPTQVEPKPNHLLDLDELPPLNSDRDRELLNALDLVNSTKYAAAIEIVQAFLQSHPNASAAHELLGAAQILNGQADQGLKHLQDAVRLNPGQSTAMTKIGDVYLAKGDSGKAKEQFLKAVETDPENSRAHQRLGILFEKEGRVDLAIAHYEKGLAGTPVGYIGIKVNLGGLYNQMHRFDKAIALLGTLITEDNKNATGHFVLGNAYLGVKKPEQALHQYELVAKLEPQAERAPLALGMVYREQQNYPASLKELEKVVTMKPSWPTGFYQMGETFLAMGQYDKALESYAQAQKLSDSPILINKRIGTVYLKQQKYAEAIAVFKKVLATTHAGMESYDQLASAYQASQQADLAEKTYRSMVENFPKETFPLYRLGIFYGSLRKYDRAITELKKAEALSPDDAAVMKALSIAYSRQGQHALALQFARKFVKLHSDSIPDKFYLAALTQDAGHTKEAMALYQEILVEDPKHALAMNNMAAVLLEKGDRDHALDMARKAASLAPDNAAVLDTLGWALFKQAKQGEAVTALQKSVALMPKNPGSLYHLAAVEHAMGNKQEAKKHLEQALGLSTGFKGVDEAKRLLASLEAASPAKRP